MILHDGLEKRLTLSLLSHDAVTHFTQFHVIVSNKDKHGDLWAMFIVHPPLCENPEPTPSKRRVFDPGGQKHLCMD